MIVHDTFIVGRCRLRSVSLVVALLLPLATLPALSQSRQFQLAPLFGDHAVLQQKSEVPVWGKGTPGSRVTIVASWGMTAYTLVNTDGSWLLRVGTPAAGGPYTMTINHPDTACILNDILVGEVWLCSGQSNMEMSLRGWPPGDTIAKYEEEIRNSSHPNIRLYSVRRTYSSSPEFSCNGSWAECSPATSAGFSATAYFFGRTLHDSLKVPIGLIHSSWGGTPVEAWTAVEYLSRFRQYDSILHRMHESVADMARLREWLAGFPQVDLSARTGPDRWRNLAFRDDACSSVSLNDSAWHGMQLPVLWEQTDLGDFDGVVWFRKKIDVPLSWLHHDLVLELGPIDDMDIAFVNGTEVGRQEGGGFWRTDRVYRVPNNLVDTTVCVIAVRVMDTGGGGGLWGKPASLAIHPEGSGEQISLSGSWKYLPVAEFREEKFISFGAAGEPYWKRPRVAVEMSPHVPTSLYNGMIAPLVPYSIRGVIWYQGESNVDAPRLYRDVFPAMIKNWRSAFQSPGMPFYYVQLAPFAYDPPGRSEFLREAQFKTLSLENTGMAVTLDIGNPKNIHPANKQDVGKRLALWALARTYGRPVTCSGPLYRTMKIEKDRIVLSFDNAAKGLALKAKKLGNGFQIAGEDKVFKDATVVVNGDKLIVSSREVKNPVAVRYAFSNTPEATLFNRGGLPAPSFRTDEWEE